jgi:hypothetical protein
MQAINRAAARRTTPLGKLMAIEDMGCGHRTPRDVVRGRITESTVYVDAGLNIMA